MSNQALITALIALPEHELVEVVGEALAQRKAEVSRPEWEEAKLFLAKAHRFNERSGVSSDWEILALARALDESHLIADGTGPTEEGGCCGFTLAAYAKRVICPLCGEIAYAT